MGFFSRKAPKGGGQAMQYPDELAEQAATQYGTGDFSGAFETYATAIDKIHTMCVVSNPGSRIRTPGPQDQPILDGVNNSLGAALSMNPQANVSSSVEKTIEYLRQIANEAGAEAGRYVQTMEEIERTYRLGTS